MQDAATVDRAPRRLQLHTVRQPLITEIETVLYRKLGRTGLDVSLLGLGTGGARQMGKSPGHPVHRQHELVHRCLELGINLFDTAEAYEDTEATLGAALNGVDRRSYILVTKWSYFS